MMFPPNDTASMPVICHKCQREIMLGEPVTWFNITFGAAGSVPATMRPHHYTCAAPIVSALSPPAHADERPNNQDIAAELVEKIQQMNWEVGVPVINFYDAINLVTDALDEAEKRAATARAEQPAAEALTLRHWVDAIHKEITSPVPDDSMTDAITRGVAPLVAQYEALVRLESEWRASAEAMRKACAEVCDDYVAGYKSGRACDDWASGEACAARDIKAAILALPAPTGDWVLVPRAELEPFAKEAHYWRDIPGVVKTHEDVELWQNPSHRTKMTVGNLRRIAERLAATPSKEK